MWSIFKRVFAEEYRDLVEDTKVANRDSGSHSTNVMQEIGGALKHLSMAAGEYKDIVANII